MTVWVGSLPLGGRVLVSVPKSKRALRWEESKISGAAAGRCGFRRPKERRWEGTQDSKPLGGTSISLQGG